MMERQFPRKSAAGSPLRFLSPCLVLTGMLLSVPLRTLSGAYAPDYYGIDGSNGLVNLADVLGAQSFYNAGIYGQKTVSWVVDAQLVGTNLFPAEKFTNVAYTYASSDALTAPGDHATWCAGLLGGYVPPGYYLNTGTAPGTTLGSAALATSLNADGSFDISTNSLSAYTYAASHGDVLSTSVGDASDNAGVGILSGLLDAAAWANPRTAMVAAAGNSGPAVGGLGTIGGPASGYNGISVGALDAPPGYGEVASFSSAGPLQTAWYDGTNTHFYGNGTATRAGVSLLAPGAGIVMPDTMTVSGDSVFLSYYKIAGTSFATPLVAGGAALLDSTAKTSFDPAVAAAATESVVIKAVLMNSADKLPGWDNGQRIVNGVITTVQALDYAMGAGRMNLNEAFSQYTTSAAVTTTPGISYSGFTTDVQKTGWAYGTALLGGSNSYHLLDQLFGGQQMAVTLCWMRSRTWSADVADFLDKAQSELDLLVYRMVPGGRELIAESASPVGTTQELDFTVPVNGSYFIDVRYATNLFDLTGTYQSQDYGLAWSVAVVPEPATAALFALGLLLLAVRTGRRPGNSSGSPEKATQDTTFP